MDTLSRFKGVNTVRYQGDDFNNAQHNYDTLQAYIDNVQFHQFNLTTNIVKAEMQVYILGKPNTDKMDDVLDIQDKAYDCALNVLAYMDTKSEFNGMLRLYDYSILTLADYTSQRNAGVKLSIVLEMPNGVNLCELDEHFGEPIPSDDGDELNITTIKLPINNRC